jgi:hypothetical protein
MTHDGWMEYDTGPDATQKGRRIMNTRKAITTLGVVTAALALACSTLSTDVDYDHTISFAKYHTFQLATGTPDPVTFTQKRIENAVTSTLTSKGWQAVTSDPDVFVYTHVALSEQKQWNATSMGGFGYRGWRGMGGGMATATETNIPIGTLIVDLVDSKTKEMIWRGVARNQVKQNGDAAGQIEDAVQALFKNFPPGSAQ